MGIIAKDNGGEFEPIPLGIHKAICINVFDIGYQPGFQNGPPHHQVVLLWEIEPTQTWEPNVGKHFTVTKFYTLSINKKSNLGQDLESWRSIPFTPEQMEGFDLDNIIGKPCQINLVANGDKAKVAAVLPAAKAQGPDGKMHNVQYWAPENKRDFVPKFIDKKRAEAVPEPTRNAKTMQTRDVVADDGFTDQIPF
jgi:hypothetical protein